jgi:hypothetical protein
MNDESLNTDVAAVVLEIDTVRGKPVGFVWDETDVSAIV